MKRHIPNILTLLNLFSGMVACVFALKGFLIEASFFIFLGIFFDFFDGFFARILGVQGELGKQLDSLSDLVTSGVAPSFIVFYLLEGNTDFSRVMEYQGQSWNSLAFLSFLLALGASYRLANFNIDKRQSDSFIGLPTPAMALVVVSLPLILKYSSFEEIKTLVIHPFFLVPLIFLLSYLMNAEIPLFALKFKDFSWKNNWFRWVFLGISIVLLIGLQAVAIPIIILFYILFSVILNRIKS